jgi:amidase
MQQRTRREFLLATGAVALAGTLSTRAWPRRAFAQTPGTISPSEWDYRSAKETAAALQARRISAVELTDHVIARIEALDQKINAVVVRDFDRAREAAKAADAALARGERRPLIGVPLTIKESFNVGGLPTTWGLVAAKGFVPQEDALAVARLKAAGGVVLGKTNVPLMLADWQSYNDIYGTTNNPWDLSRTPGGSSGGSAAALAAGFGPLSLGSDIGGSLRVPANFCGVYGHKPTHGIIPRRGHAPPGAKAIPRDIDLAVVGPMARSASDLALELDILAGPDELRDAVGYRLALPPPRHGALKDFRVLVIDTHPLLPTSASVRAALEKLSERLGKAGVTIASESPLVPDFASARSVCAARCSAIAIGWRPTAPGPDCASAGASCLPNGTSSSARRCRRRPIRTTTRCPTTRAGSTSTARNIRIRTSWSGPASPRPRGCQRRRRRSTAPTPACRSGCRSSAPILRTARRSPLPS